MTELPPDIDPQSGCRLPLPRRENLEGEALAAFDGFQNGGGGSLAGLKGPVGIRLHSPELAVMAIRVTWHLRFETFDPWTRQIAILVTAREMDSAFEWAAHEPQSLKDGVSPEIIDVIKFRRDLDGLPAEAVDIIQLGREMFGHHRVAPETFKRIHARLGDRKTVELVSLMADYSATASLLAAVDAQVPPDRPVLPRLEAEPARIS